MKVGQGHPGAPRGRQVAHAHTIEAHTGHTSIRKDRERKGTQDETDRQTERQTYRQRDRVTHARAGLCHQA